MFKVLICINGLFVVGLSQGGLSGFGPEGVKMGITSLLDTKGFEVTESKLVSCRQGFVGVVGDKYTTDFVACKDRLAATSPTNATIECVRLCQWQIYNYVDNENGALSVNRTAVENGIKNEYSTSVEGQNSVKTYVEDFVACFNETKPDLKYDEGCKSSQAFSKCFNDKSNKFCPALAL